MTFVDSSALVAAIAPEDDGKVHADRIDRAESPVTSSIAIFETTLALARVRDIPAGEALLIVLEFLDRASVEVIPIGSDAYIHAVGAHSRYGKGTGHPAQLNLGDCFAYAVAKQSRGPLLYKGGDFIHTDLA